jgi:hypothetical protein
MYSLRFKIKVTFGHKLRYEVKVMFGEISLKLHQTNWNVSKNKANVVVDSIDSFKMIDNSPKVSILNRLFLKLNWFICT